MLRRQRQHAADLAHHRVRQRMVGLVDDDDVRDLHHAGLERLDRVAGAGDQHQHDRVGVVDHVDLGLPDADRLEEDVLLAGGVHQQRGLQRRLGQPAERAARRHRADEHAGVEEVLGEPDPVAQQRAAAERRGRVDREHRDLAVQRALVLDQRADQRRLAGAGRPGEADDRGVAGVRVDRLDERPALGVVVLDQRDPARQRALVTAQQPLGQGVRHGRRQDSLGARWRRCPGPLPRRPCTACPLPLRGGPLALAALPASPPDAEPQVRAAVRALGLAEAALGLAPADRRHLLRRPEGEARDRARRGAQARPLVVARPRHEDPRPRGRVRDRREDRVRPGVHDLGLPARLDRARVHDRRPRDADRLRPRRRRGRAPDPPAGHLQARRAGRVQLLDRLRRLHPARRDDRRQRDRRHQHRGHEGRPGQRRGGGPARAHREDARRAGNAALAPSSRRPARARCPGRRRAWRPSRPAWPRRPPRDRRCRPCRARWRG